MTYKINTSNTSWTFITSVIKFLPDMLHVCGRNLNTGLTSAASPRVDRSSICKVGQTWSVSPSVDMLPFGVTIPAAVPQRSEIPERLTNYPVFVGFQYGTCFILTFWIMEIEVSLDF